jgi:hypothetical protein
VASAQISSAVGRGDVAGLLAVLAPDVELRARGLRGTAVVRGARKVATQAMIGVRPGAVAHPALVDGVPGALITVGGRPVTVIAFTVADGAVTAIRTVTDPGWLAQIVPSWVA